MSSVGRPRQDRTMLRYRSFWSVVCLMTFAFHAKANQNSTWGGNDHFKNQTNVYEIIFDSDENLNSSIITANNDVMCELTKVDSFYKVVRTLANGSDKNISSVSGVLEGRVGGSSYCEKNKSGKCVSKEVEECLSGEDCRESRLARHFFAALPPFAVTSSNVANRKCLADSHLFLQELNRFSTWALKMHDASAKLPSGFLNGNVNQYGDFDQCLGVNSGPRAGDVRGKYCLANLEVGVSEDLGHLQYLHKLVHSHYAFRSTFEDPGHRVPRFTSINWGLCVPASCRSYDVHLELERVIQSQLSDTGLQVRVKVEPAMCVVQTGWTLPYSTILVGLFFLSVISLVAVATLLTWRPGTNVQRPGTDTEKRPGTDTERRPGTDVQRPGTDTERQPGTVKQVVEAFSLHRNLPSLFSVAPSFDDLESVHGIRLINAYMLLICHKSMAMFYNPYVNRTSMTEGLGTSWTVVARAASLYTDPFVMLSGLLTSYTYFRYLETKKGIRITHEYASRMFRLVPNLAAIILFCTFILPWLGSGPQWSLVINQHADICKVHWWKNLLFIHNYFGFENMCLTHTHHLGIDTQLFVVAPALVYLLWRWPKFGGGALVAIAAFSTYLRYHVTFTKHLSVFVYFGISVSQMFRTANLSYIIPSHRLTVYIMGIFLGYVLRHCGRRYTLKKLYLVFGWSLTAVLFYLALLDPARMGRLSYVYDPTDAANYAAFAPIFWCLVFAWIIFATHTGNGGFIGRVLSWRGFKVATRLSYAFYLTQFPVFFYNVGRTRSAEHYNITMMVNIPETLVIIAVSIVLTLLFDLPFQNIRNILLKKTRSIPS